MEKIGSRIRDGKNSDPGRKSRIRNTAWDRGSGAKECNYVRVTVELVSSVYGTQQCQAALLQLRLGAVPAHIPTVGIRPNLVATNVKLATVQSAQGETALMQHRLEDYYTFFPYTI